MILTTMTVGAAGSFVAWQWGWLAVVPLLVVWAGVLAFFRDPVRRTALPAGELCAPADGRVTEVRRLDHHDLVGGPAWKIGIFLSIFNVHINRSPCAGTIASVRHTPGRFLDARDPNSSARNEANTLVIVPDPPVAGPVVVRQVAGRIARRIICHLAPGHTVTTGQRFGMIKFGSRTELIVPVVESNEVAVEVGAKVKAGVSVLVRPVRAVQEGVSDARHRPGRPVQPAALA